ncbi:MAG: AI-2E family transporter [Labilithrix sp.]|nr:AI-2E family transporter [Labilithrix sp.]MCW5812598.1 AI-2E family transporter [Labilithrix sp.]
MLARPAAIHVVAAGMTVAAAAVVVFPFWPWILVALWISGLVASPCERLLARARHRGPLAALLTAAVLLGIAAPVVAIVVPLSLEAAELVRRVIASGDARKMLEALLSPTNGGGMPTVEELLRLGSTEGGRAYAFARAVAGATSHAALGLVVFVTVVYVRLAHAAAVRAWALAHAPVAPAILSRLAAAFSETGRGLIIGTGGAGVAQGTVATIAYVALGVPHPLVLGLLTTFTAMVPGVGAAFVWVPVAAALALTGRLTAAIALVLIGVAIVGTVDNVVRPVLARYGRLDLPIPLVFVSMLGGFSVAGPAGLLLGPLVVRLAKECLLLSREAAAT